jgi:cytoskeletal protein RodZ
LRRPLADTLPLRLLQIGGAIVLVIILIFVFNQVFASNKTTSNDTQPVATHTTTATAAGAPTSSPGAATTTGGTKTSSPAQPTKTSAPAKTTAPTTKPTTKPTSKPTAKPTSKPTAKPTAKPTTAPPPPVAVKAPLLVLNNSRIHGLAEVGEATFSKGGWTVVGTGNYSGRLPETTVFYSPGFNAAAQTLARQFPTITAIQPRPAGVPGSALTVVLTRYFKP